MKKDNMDTRIREAYTKATPDCFDQVCADCTTAKPTVIPMPIHYRRRWIRTAAGMAAALVVMASGVGMHLYGSSHKPVSTVSLDVNPSVEIALSKKEQVLDVVPLNDDGKAIIGDMDFENSDLEITVNALIGSMLKNGYLSSMSNSVLVSVDGKDADQLQKKLSADIDTYLKQAGIEGSVLSQVVEDKEAQKLADKYGLSVGKAQFIRQLIAANPRLSADELAKLTIHELNVLAQNLDKAMEHMEATGTPNELGYINTKTAVIAALKHAGIAPDTAKNIDVDMEVEDGRMVYEVEFDANGRSYEILIDAKNGTVVPNVPDKDEEDDDKDDIYDQDDKDDHDNDKDDPDDDRDDEDDKDEDDSEIALPADKLIGTGAAMKAALQKYGFAANQVTLLACDIETEKGKAVYEVEFAKDGKKYEVDVDAVTGQVQKAKQETLKKPLPSNVKMDVAAAMQMAMQDAGVTPAQATKVAYDTDVEPQKVTYELNFTANGYEYSYDVDAATGRIIDKEKEPAKNQK